MTVSLRIRIPVLLVLPALLLALAASMVVTTSAHAADPGTPAFCSEVPQHESCANLPNDDGCFGCESGSCEYNSAIFASDPACVAPAPAPAPEPEPAPAPAPAPVDACPDDNGLQTDVSQCTPAEALVDPAQESDIEASSLTIQTVQNDPPATLGPEETVLAATAAGGGGTSAVVTPSGSLPVTGLESTIGMALLGISLLWAGSLAWFVGTVLRRRRHVADAA